MKLEDQITENELITLLSRKEPAAINYLYDKYSAALYGIILRIVGIEEIAEELLQDAFVKICLHISSYDSRKGKLFTWMLNIARNLAIDKLRSKEFKRTAQTAPLEKNVYAVEASGFSELSVEGIGLKEVLKKLPPDHQQLIELLYFRGYTQSEVSEELHMPLGTVKTRLRTAMTQLRKMLNLP